LRATHRDVRFHKTGHGEVVHVKFDLMKYPMGTLLICFGQYITLQLKVDRVGI